MFCSFLVFILALECISGDFLFTVNSNNQAILVSPETGKTIKSKEGVPRGSIETVQDSSKGCTYYVADANYFYFVDCSTLEMKKKVKFESSQLTNLEYDSLNDVMYGIVQEPKSLPGFNTFLEIFTETGWFPKTFTGKKVFQIDSSSDMVMYTSCLDEVNQRLVILEAEEATNIWYLVVLDIRKKQWKKIAMTENFSTKIACLPGSRNQTFVYYTMGFSVFRHDVVNDIKEKVATYKNPLVLNVAVSKDGKMLYGDFQPSGEWHVCDLTIGNCTMVGQHPLEYDGDLSWSKKQF